MTTTSFEKQWNLAIADFNKTTGTTAIETWLPEFEGITLESFLRKIEDQNQKHREFCGRSEHMRDSISKFLRPALLFSDIIGTAVSIAYPPAQAIFAATSFLIKAADGLSSIYDAIAELLMEMSYSSQRLALYCKRGILPQLVPIARAEFELYLKILATAIKFREGRFSRLKFFGARSFLGVDSGLNDLLNQLRKITDKELEMVVASIMDIELDTNGLLREIADYLGVRTIESNKELTIYAPSRALGDSTRLPEPIIEAELHSGQILGDKRNKQHGKIGEWIYDEDEFLNWCQGKFWLLWVSGSPGTGKSFIAYHIVQYIRQLEEQPQNNLSTTSIAYFFYLPETQIEPRIMMNSMIISIINQIAAQDRSYAKYLCNLGKPDGFQTSTLWEHFIQGFYLKPDISSTVFIVLYGVDKIESPELSEFLCALEACGEAQIDIRPRISLALITDYTIGPDIESYLSLGLRRIEVLPEKTKSNIEEYIKFRVLKKLPRLRKMKALREEVARGLQMNANGSFLWVNDMITTMKPLTDKIQFLKCISNPPKTWHDVFRSNLELFSTKMAGNEVELLNYILAWTTLEASPLSLRALGQALSIRYEEPSPTLGLPGLIDFSYGYIFNLRTLKGELISLDKPLIKSNILPLERLLRSESRVKETGENQEKEDESDVNSEDEDDDDEGKPQDDQVFISFKHTAVRDYFLLEMSAPTDKISINIRSARIMVLKKCLQVFCDSRKYRTCKRGLADRAARFSQYLLDTDQESCESEDKREIGQLLIRLLNNAEPLERWISKAGPALTTDFLDSQLCVEKITRWLTDPEVAQYLDTSLSNENWVGDLKSAPFRCLFGKAAAVCASRWIQTRYKRSETDVMFLHSYMTKAFETLEGSQHMLKQLPVERIEQLWQWAQSILSPDKKIYRHRLAVTFLRAGKIYKAIEHGLVAIHENPDDGFAHSVLAQAYIKTQEFEKACEHLRMGQALLSNEKAKFRIRNFLKLYSFGSRYSPIPMPDVPGVDEDCPIWLDEDFLDLLLRHESFEEATKVIENLTKVPLFKYRSKYWRAFFWDLSRHIMHNHRLIIYASKGPRNFDLVEALYQRGLKVLFMWHIDGARPVFRYYYARLHIILGSQTEDALKVLETAVDEFSKHMILDEYQSLKYIAEVDLQVLYLTRALEIKPMVAIDETRRDDEYFENPGDTNRKSDPSKRNTFALTKAIWYRHRRRAADLRALLQPHFREALETIENQLQKSEEEHDDYCSSTFAHKAATDFHDSFLLSQHLLVDGLSAKSHYKAGNHILNNPPAYLDS
ncbi:hypothetical protein H072_5263 [Dactylellina haptotyla CBS 200.50]|uniref:Uncharacterized protein n=1 Tax=Dactylellina haptotyla (strain CBS 200.50) TaxID=1284197 RepID=S8AD61_DACHA|nr:hypothetical protein H072_5263 [Dactylellina haptotyla CBS 200.50]